MTTCSNCPNRFISNDDLKPIFLCHLSLCLDCGKLSINDTYGAAGFSFLESLANAKNDIQACAKSQLCLVSNNLNPERRFSKLVPKKLFNYLVSFTIVLSSFRVTKNRPIDSQVFDLLRTRRDDEDVSRVDIEFLFLRNFSGVGSV